MLNSKRKRDIEEEKKSLPTINLPITGYREEILRKISKNKVTIISG